MTEWIDLYDLQHQATGQIHPRGQQVPPGRCTLVVSFWIRDGAGRLLLLRRSGEKRWFPDWWECGGGCARAGETGYDAVVREVAEETGLTPPPRAWRYLGELENVEDLEGVHFHHWNLSYLAALEDPFPTLTLQREEVAQGRWFTPEELDAFLDSDLVTVYTRRLWVAYRSALTAPLPSAKTKAKR